MSEASNNRAAATASVASPALTASAAFLAGVAALIATAPRAIDRLVALATRSLSSGGEDLVATGPALAKDAALAFAWLVGPTALAAFAAAALAGLIQDSRFFAVRSRDSTAAPSRRARAGWLRPSAFFVAAAASVAFFLSRERATLDSILSHAGAAPIHAALALAARLAVRVAFVLVAAGVIDFALRYLAHLRALHPSRAQSRRAQRESGADPRLRAEQRRRQRDDSASPSARS